MNRVTLEAAGKAVAVLESLGYVWLDGDHRNWIGPAPAPAPEPLPITMEDYESAFIKLTFTDGDVATFRKKHIVQISVNSRTGHTIINGNFAVRESVEQILSLLDPK